MYSGKNFYNITAISKINENEENPCDGHSLNTDQGKNQSCIAKQKFYLGGVKTVK